MTISSGNFSAEAADIVVEIERPFSLYQPPLQVVPVVVDVPHAGRRYPPAFVERARLPLRSLRRSEDAYVDRLFAQTVALGAPLLVAEFPRAFLDVNREPYELDPRMFDGRLPAFANTRSLRVAGGSAQFRASSAMRTRSISARFRWRTHSPGSTSSIAPTMPGCAAWSSARKAPSAPAFWSTPIRCRRRGSTATGSPSRM
ncbi:N-formylglutamate deformylase [Bosea sp. BIWAKO-01]|nr:N-formylglutamate deformylase [Bosea sp. BIWAKO-01]